ncbi:MAG: NAD-dependent epimerase/dehydratase family protein, partial [Acetobacter sp.]|nr:NAD-dependent epimerase/dehydratase family protein [Acetobacter sp.]MBQ5479524.1 NAD-dependent epimerase/dehydratase family protein [Acetobacter sp.]
MTAPTLVTGATGFVGSAVARILHDRGHSLRLMVRKGSDLRNIAELSAEIVDGDLLRPDTFERAVKGCRYVFHVAADYRLWVPDPAPMMTANVEGTRLLMRAALNARVERIVYCSSVAALGLIGDGSIADETTPIREHAVIGVYKRSKYRAEQEVLRLIREQSLPAVIVNPSTPVGPRDIKPTPTGQMILDCAAGRMPAYVDTGVNIVHVDDVAIGHALALEQGKIGEKYILGGENFLLHDLFDMVSRIAHVAPPRVRLSQEVIWPVAVVSEWLSRAFG